MSHFKLLTLPKFTDEKGSLSVVDGDLPFKVVRSYWIYNASGKTRGGHRHKDTIQALVALNGAVDVYMADGVKEQTISLKQPDKCLIVEPKDWHTMTFYDGSVLLVMASTHFDKNDYVAIPYRSLEYD